MNDELIAEASGPGFTGLRSEARVDDRIGSAGRDITVPLDRLVRSPNNVRKHRSAQTIPQLAAMIRTMGLLQRLLVTAGEGGRYAVEGGARRLAALELLAAEGHIAPDAPIDCRVYPSRQAVEVSLAENAGQERMHPADEYEAFAKLVDQGLTTAQVAGRFGVSAQTVARCMALGRVAPRFLDLYRAGEANREQLQALALSDDHAQQIAAWDGLSPYQRSAYMLRQRLLQDDVRADSDAAQFVGIEVYEAAGGHIRRDLFSEEGDAWMTDRALLNRLALQKLEQLAAVERANGWSWVEAQPSVDAAARRAFEVQRPGERALSREEAAGLADWLALAEAARAEFDAAQRATMDAQPGSDAEIAAAEREERAEDTLDGLEDALAVIKADMEAWSDEQKATCGVLVTIGANGAACIRRGLRRLDERAPGEQDRCAKRGARRHDDAGDAAGVPARPAYAERLMLDLTSHRTAALQAALLDAPHVALVAVVHRLALPIFCTLSSDADSPVKIRAWLTRHSKLSAQASGYADSPAAAVLDAAASRWADLLPGEPAALFAWLLRKDDALLLELLPFCTASALDAIAPRESDTVEPADRLADALDLDMADWWTATEGSYLASVSKAQIVEAVTEACGAAAAQPLLAMKKAETVTHAAALLNGKRWLPRPLRRKPVVNA